MKQSTINATQAGMLCTIIILANKITLLPGLLYQGTKSDGFFSMILLFFVEICVLGIFFLLKRRFPDTSLSEILSKHLGKWIAKIIFLLLLVFFLAKLLLSYSVAYLYLKEQVYQGEFALLAVICFLPVINHAVIKGLRVFTRTIELFYFIVCGGVVLCLAVSFLGKLNMPLFFTSAPSDFFLTTFKYIFSFGDFLFLFLIIDKIEIQKGEEKKILRFVAVGVTLVLLITFIFFCLYQVTAFMHNNALADITVSAVQFGAIGRLDVFAMVTRMFLSVIEMEIFLFAFSETFCNIFTRLNRTYSVVVFDVIFALVYVLLTGKFENVLSYTENWLPYVGIFTNYVLPITLLIISLLSLKKEKKKYEKNY